MTAEPAATAAAPAAVDTIDTIDTVASAVAAAVLAVPGVAALHAGSFGEVATYLPGRRITGVRLGEPGAEVHVVLELGEPIRDVAERIRERVLEIVRGPVRVVVEDLATEPVEPVEPVGPAVAAS